MRITEHPILGFAPRRKKEAHFSFDGQSMLGYEGETIAAALHAAGVRTLRRSLVHGRPRGFFCAIGKCASCLMRVDGMDNVRVCITPLREGMAIETQSGKGVPDSGGEDIQRQKIQRPIEKRTDVAIIGAGPAGLSAAIQAATMGARVTLIDENAQAGGQLIKQTHRFFGGKAQYAGIRGVDIAPRLLGELDGGELLLDATAIGCYQDVKEEKVLAVVQDGRLIRIRTNAVVIAAGAQENMLAFPQNDLPGVYGAGAVQTLMNVYGIKPGQKVLMVGAGNVGLIVSYQLLQAGVDVVGVVEAMPHIGGYHVHAAKLRRCGVPIWVSHTIQRVSGENKEGGGKDKEGIKKAVIVELDEQYRPIDGTEREVEVDVVCLAVGLTPTTELLHQAGCEMAYVPKLGGWVALHDDGLETTMQGVYVAGDASGVEEASTAMLEGQLAGVMAAAQTIGTEEAWQKARTAQEEIAGQLAALRSGPFGEDARIGKEKIRREWEERR